MIDDSASTANAEGSAIAVAAAINDSSEATGVTARVGEPRDRCGCNRGSSWDGRHH